MGHSRNHYLPKMNRLGLLPPTSLDEEQKELYDDFTSYTGSHYGDR